jgi:histidyl-tRNA synthetase
MATSPTLPKGTRDFTALDLAKRRYVVDRLRSAFERFGFGPLETPSFENLETLMGKYGEEGDRLVFKILKSGNFLESVPEGAVPRASEVADKALRYDLTVPFARFVSQNQGKIPIPYKRYQIQPVWRADRPQKGRFREFYQCDADVVGSKSLWQEVELVDLYTTAFASLGLSVTVRINHRGLLAALADEFGLGDRLIDFTVAVDKLDKVGVEGVLTELQNKGVEAAGLERVRALIATPRSTSESLAYLAAALGQHPEGMRGIEDVRFVLAHIAEPQQVVLDLTLARGLNYYTGAIFEVTANDVEMGSIGGGGRYDDLTSIFGGKGLPGIGISFGLDRIVLCLEALNAFPLDQLGHAPSVMALHPGNPEEVQAVYAVVREWRGAGISAEFYPDAAAVKKQYAWAEQRGIRWILQRMEGDQVFLKDTSSGDVISYSVDDCNTLIDLFN